MRNAFGRWAPLITGGFVCLEVEEIRFPHVKENQHFLESNTIIGNCFCFKDSWFIWWVLMCPRVWLHCNVSANRKSTFHFKLNKCTTLYKNVNSYIAIISEFDNVDIKTLYTHCWWLTLTFSLLPRSLCVCARVCVCVAAKFLLHTVHATEGLWQLFSISVNLNQHHPGFEVMVEGCLPVPVPAPIYKNNIPAIMKL